MTKKTCSCFWIEYFPRKVIKSKLQLIDAYEALECFDQTDIAVALLDIRMHPIDGIALLVEIKKRSPSTHVIMISSFLTTENESRCIQYGAIDYLPKPLEIQKLKIALRGLLAG